MKNNKKYDYIYVKNKFEEKNYILLEEKYINIKFKMKYLCNVHKDYGIQEVSFARIISSESTCYKCKANNISDRQIKSNEYRKKELKPICDKLNLIYIDYKHVDGYLYAGFICKKHKEKGVQYSRKDQLKKETIGCKYCSNKIIDINDLKNHKGLASNVEVIGKYIKSSIPIECKCKICGNIWKDTPNHLQSGRTCYCSYYSKGERKIADILNKNDVKFKPQYYFNDCIYNSKLFFDFYLPEYNICIEYNGEQHYKPINYFGGEDKFKIQQKRDNIKRKYCINNNILLIEIPYYEFKNIENIIKINVLKSLETAGY